MLKERGRSPNGDQERTLHDPGNKERLEPDRHARLRFGIPQREILPASLMIH